MLQILCSQKGGRCRTHLDRLQLQEKILCASPGTEGAQQCRGDSGGATFARTNKFGMEDRAAMLAVSSVSWGPCVNCEGHGLTSCTRKK